MANCKDPSNTSSRSSKSIQDSIFSRSSTQSAETTCSSHDSRPSLKQSSSKSCHLTRHVQSLKSSNHEGRCRESTSSVATYASTQASHDDLPSISLDQFPRHRKRIFEPDSLPSTPAEFAQLFPSTRRMMIQHDDSMADGNMHLRVDTDITTPDGQSRKMTLFHLKMNDLLDRRFSLRRYWCASGREVCSSKRRYVKPIPAGYRPPRPDSRQVSTDPYIGKRAWPSRPDLGCESDQDDDDDELVESLRAFTIANNVEATVPTDAIRLEFSNYAQIIMDPQQTGCMKHYDFEYWGDYYSWKKRALRDGDEIVNSYELINLITNTKMSSIVPDALSKEEGEFEASQGAWIPACSMRILPKGIPDDLGDVIVATGLMALADDCVPE